MEHPDTDADRLLRLSTEMGAFRLADARNHGVHPETVYRLVRRGELERVGRGLYRAAEAMVTEHHGLVLATMVVPSGVVCLLSALSYHGLTTQLPFEVWMALDRRAAAPRDPAVQVRIMRFSGAALALGIEAYELEGTQVRVYSAAKTVVDCFRYRNLVGMDVAIEALRDCLQQRKSSPGELWDLAKACRIGSVMRPYIEALA
ncbi:MAG: type IV toxin-antitoxin system AbiEi family antitoxin domain-containing protein [Actinomycetes bacterium]